VKLADVDVQDLITALRDERSVGISAAREEHRKPTDAEEITFCVLRALECALAAAISRRETEVYDPTLGA